MLAVRLSGMNSLRISQSILLLASLIAASLCPAAVLGQTDSSWNGGPGNWNTATNWNPNAVPNDGGGNTYNVAIDSSSADTVTLDISATVNSLVLGGAEGSTLENQPGTAENLTITGALTVNQTGSLTFNNASGLTVGGNFSNAGYIAIESGSTMTVSGNLTNTGTVAAGPLTVTGTFTNQSDTAQLYVAGVTKVGMLVNNGYVLIGATLTLTDQPNGITDVGAGSALLVDATLNAGSNNGLANLANIEGSLFLRNGQTTTATPGSGTLTISSTGFLDLENSTILTLNGSLTNSGLVETNTQNTGSDTLTVTGTFTNSAGAHLNVGSNDMVQIGTLTNSGMVTLGGGSTVNIGTLTNSGYLSISGTLNLTSQPNGITDVVAGSTLDVAGTFNAASNNGLAQLGSIEGTLILENGQTTPVTPGSGTLTISSTGLLDLENSTTLDLYGALVNNGGTVTIGAGSVLSLMNTSSLSGKVNVQQGAMLNLANDITDVPETLDLQVAGTIDVTAGSSRPAGGSNALSKLSTVEGILELSNGQSTTVLQPLAIIRGTKGGPPLTPAVQDSTSTLSAGSLDVSGSTTLMVDGNLTSNGWVSTNFSNIAGSKNVLTVTGTFDNEAGGELTVGENDNTNDVANIGMLTNEGDVYIGQGAVLNLTSQSNGVTDVGARSTLDVRGTLNVMNGGMPSNGLTNLTSIEGFLILERQSTTATPGSGVLTISKGGHLQLERSTSLTVSGNLSNSGMVTTNHSGGGNLNILTVTGTFTNEVGGVLFVGEYGATTDVAKIGVLDNSGTVTVGTGATLELTSAATSDNAGTIKLDVGTLEITGGGSLALTGSAFSGTGKYTINATGTGSTVQLGGGVNITGGTLTTAAGGVIETQGGQKATLNGATNSGIFDLMDDSTTTLIGTINNTGTISLNSTGDTTNIMVGATSVTLKGNGTLVLGTGGSNIIAGMSSTDKLTNSSTIEGAGNIGDGTMGLINSSSGTIIANASGPLTVQVNSEKFTNSGKLVVSSGSTMNIMGPANSFTDTGTVTVSSGGTLEMEGSLNYTQTTGTTTIDGTLGVLRANSIMIQGGTLYGNRGTLDGNFSLSDAAVLNPGDGSTQIGDLTIDGSYTQGSNSSLTINLGGTAADTGYSVLNVADVASLSGKLNVKLVNGFTPTVGETFDILNYASTTGTFSTKSLPMLPGGDTWSISYNATDVVLTVEAPAGSAGNGAVTGSPAKRVSRNMGPVASPTGTHEPVAILSRAICFGATLLMASASCSTDSVANGSEMPTAAFAGSRSGSVHNNIMVATRSALTARGGASHETSVSTAAMARLYVCAYLPASIGHTMGCN